MKIKISVFCWEGCTYSQIGLSKATPPLPFTSFLIPLLGLFTQRIYKGNTYLGNCKGAWLFQKWRQKYSSDLPLEGRAGPQQVCLPYESWDLSGVGTDSRQRSTGGRPGPQKVCLPYESWNLSGVGTYSKPRSSKKRRELRVSEWVRVHDDPLLYVLIREYNLPLETSE